MNRKDIERELRLLQGSADDVERLSDIVKKRIASLESQKDAARARAEADVDSYSRRQWERSWFTRDEREAAIVARAREIFERPERRALDAAKAARDLAKAMKKVLAATDGKRRAEETRRIGDAYRDIALSSLLNGELGLAPQIGQRLRHIVETKLPWWRDRPGPEASNVEGSGADLSRWQPTASSAWRARGAEETTPAALLRGPWYDGAAVPKLPSPDETWDIVELRSQKADGAHASIEIGLGDATVKLKLHSDADLGVWTEPVFARLVWAMGYETDPQYLVRDVRVTPRVFCAAHASIARVGLKLGSAEDEVIAGRPPRGLAFSLNGMNRAPGPGYVDVRYRDGREEGGKVAIESLHRAMDDRALLDSMESVVVKKAYVELPRPGEWDGLGPWDLDSPHHVDDREVRALALVMVSWLGSDDLKLNNLRLDVAKDDPTKQARVVADVGSVQRTDELAWDVPVSTKGRFLHSDANAYTIRAFDRMTLSDARWGVRLFGRFTEDQIVACCAAGAFDDAALALFAEKLVARRDDLVKTFGLEGELGLLRPHGPNRSTPPRAFPR